MGETIEIPTPEPSPPTEEVAGQPEAETETPVPPSAAEEPAVTSPEDAEPGADGQKPQEEPEELLQLPEDMVSEVAKLTEEHEEEEARVREANEGTADVVAQVLGEKKKADLVEATVAGMSGEEQKRVQNMLDYYQAFVHRKDDGYSYDRQRGEYKTPDDEGTRILYIEDRIAMLRVIHLAEDLEEGIRTQVGQQLSVLEKRLGDFTKFREFIRSQGFSEINGAETRKICGDVLNGRTTYEEAAQRIKSLLPESLNKAVRDLRPTNEQAMEAAKVLAELSGGKLKPEEVLQALREKGSLRNKLKENSGTLLMLLLYILMGLSAASQATSKTAEHV